MLSVAFFFSVSAISTSYSAVYTPSKFTLVDVSSAHGSDENAGCPSACVMMVSGVRVCDCVGVTPNRTGIILIDGVIPMLDVFRLNWAAQLYTATVTQDNWQIEFKFPENFMLRQVDLSLLFCPTRMIPNEGVLSISIYQSILFPTRLKALLLGNMSLSGYEQNCVDLIQISIPTNPASAYCQYLIQFSMDNVLGGIYIGEMVFSDDIISITSMESTLAETTLMKTITPTRSASFEQSTQSTPLQATTLMTTVLERSSLSQFVVTPTLLPSMNLNTEVNMTFSTHSLTMATTTESTIAILIGVIVVLFVVMALGGIACVCIMLIKTRRKSFNTNHNTNERRPSFPENYEIKETDVNREYESVEDYMNTSGKPMECHENDINLIQNQAYASTHHPQ